MFASVSATRLGIAEPWGAFISAESGRAALVASRIMLEIYYEELVTAWIADLLSARARVPAPLRYRAGDLLIPNSPGEDKEYCDVVHAQISYQ